MLGHMVLNLALAWPSCRCPGPLWHQLVDSSWGLDEVMPALEDGISCGGARVDGVSWILWRVLGMILSWGAADRVPGVCWALRLLCPLP